MKTLLPGLNSGVYNNPKKLYKGIFSLSKQPKSKASVNKSMVMPPKNVLFGYGKLGPSKGQYTFAQSYKRRLNTELKQTSSPYNHLYYKLPFTHNHNPITNPMPRNIQNPYFAKQLHHAQGSSYRKSNLGAIAKYNM